MMYFSLSRSSLLVVLDFSVGVKKKTKPQTKKSPPHNFFCSTEEVWVSRKTGKGKGEESSRVTQTSEAALGRAQENGGTFLKSSLPQQSGGRDCVFYLGKHCLHATAGNMSNKSSVMRSNLKAYSSCCAFSLKHVLFLTSCFRSW